MRLEAALCAQPSHTLTYAAALRQSRDELLPAGIAGGNGSGSGSGRESRAAIVVFYMAKQKSCDFVSAYLAQLRDKLMESKAKDIRNISQFTNAKNSLSCTECFNF